MLDVEMLYRQQLSDADRRLIANVGAPGEPFTAALGRPELAAAVFAPDATAPFEATVSPFLVFATAIHRTAAALATATFVEERWAPRVRIPVFDVAPLRALVADPLCRYFLVELLTSYTRVASGVTWVRSGQRWQRRRFSDLDPVRLISMLEIVDARERPGVFRRLGDLALFLSGVFPDRSFVPAGAGRDRLLRLSGIRGSRRDDLPDGRALLELLGSRWYASAVAGASSAGYPATGTLAAAGYMGEHFADARRVLTIVTDQYLFPLRSRWFGAG
jgi:hypothetical protein